MLKGRKEDSQAPVAIITPDTAHVPRNAVVEVTFSEPVRLVTGNELDYLNVDTLFIFKKDGPDGESIVYNANVSTDKTHVTINPSDSLDENQTYFVMVREDLLEDYSGNKLSPVSVRFSTGSEILSVGKQKNVRIRVYPNPSGEYIIIEANPDQDWKVRIFSVMGTLVAEKDDITGTRTKVGLQHLNSGIYFVVIETSKGEKIKTEKIIVQ